VETIPGTSSAQAESSKYSWAFRSHPGRERTDNEDSVGAYAPAEPDERGSLFVVCDGMGGHAAGEVASRLAVETLVNNWVGSTGGNAHQVMRSAVRSANSVVFSASLDADTRGMGTTLTSLALVGDDAMEAVIGHVGDSRCYRVRHGQCEQLTADHSRVGEMLRMRLITPEQAKNHPARSQLSRSLGGEPAVQVDIVRNPVMPKDAFVLCCDGLWDMVSMREIAHAVAKGAVDGAEQLIAMALDRGAPDNVTVIVVVMSADISMPDVGATGSRFGFLKRAADSLLGR
jgi:serine/threonine protein phosphatase PrpC